MPYCRDGLGLVTGITVTYVPTGVMVPILFRVAITIDTATFRLRSETVWRCLLQRRLNEQADGTYLRDGVVTVIDGAAVVARW